jgi:putative membrane protein
MRLLLRSLTLLLTVALLPRPALAAGATATLMPDIDFIPVAANWAFTGTLFNNLAEKQASDPKLKETAQRQTREYNQVVNKLTTIAVAMSLEIAPQLLATQQPKLEQLAGLKGAEFDRAYGKQLIEIQEELVKLFEAKAKDADNPDLKAYAAKALPGLKEQLKEVKGLTGQAPSAPPARAEITVVVPADAEVFFDGYRTMQRGTERLYFTPPLQVGKQFTYEVVVRWTRDGKPVEEKRKVEVTGGGTVRVDFTRPVPGGTGG